MMNHLKHTTSAVILSCKGGDQGDLGLVRSLGRVGVPIVFVTENPKAHSLHSKYVNNIILVESFRSNPDQVVNKLVEFARGLAEKPVLFPTADPDLELLSAKQDNLQDYYHFTSPGREIINAFLDKGRFFEYGQEKGFPLPQTYTPTSKQEIIGISGQVNYPVILKPKHPKAWTNKNINQLVGGKKALLIASREALLDKYSAIARYDNDLVVQEYISGRDDRLISVHMYIGKSGQPLGSFVGRKIRTYPAYAGIGCFVISEYSQELIDISIDILKRSGYFGLALLQFKHDSKSNKYMLLEINARTSSWNQLPLHCGVNLPYIAYLDVTNKSLPKIPIQRDNVKYIYFKPDLLAFLEYRRNHDWRLLDWLRSFRGKKTYQLFCLDDPFPFLVVTVQGFISFSKELVRQLVRRIGISVPRVPGV